MLLDLPSYTMCLVAILVGLKLHVLLIRSQILQPLLPPYDLVAWHSWRDKRHGCYPSQVLWSKDTCHYMLLVWS